jgi:hypothetical protein
MIMQRSLVIPLLTVALSAPLFGASPQAQQGEAPEPLPSVELAVNLERMKRRLAVLPAGDDERSLLKLDYYVTVYGRAPRINPLEGFDLHNGPVPFGPPTDADLRAVWTPEEFRAPVADLSSVLGWLLKR